jgi:phosphoglycerate kinase
MKSVIEAGDLKGKKVLVRVDWSVPMKDGQILDDFQIKASLPTLEYLKQAGAEIIVATHLESLNDSIEPLKKFLPEGAVMLPNLRVSAGEEANDRAFAESLAKMADLYVNDAFAVSHREHASIVGVPKLLPSFAGLRMMAEIEALSKAFNPAHPFLLLLGGAKIENKLPLVEKFSTLADDIFIGGAMAMKAHEMGLDQNPKVFLPTGDLAALDANAETLENLKLKIGNSKFIIWNGPLGKYEEGYTKYTDELALALANSGKEVIVGGGDTLVFIQKLNLLDKFSFVSTGGGAMLAFLATGTLVGIEALK